MPNERLAFDKRHIKATLLENIHQDAVDVLSGEEYPVTRHAKSLSEDELTQELTDTRVLGIRSKTRVNKTVLDGAPKLLTIGAFCVGTDQIDLEESTERGIAVFNDPISNTRSVAELAIGEIVMLSRGVTEKSNKMHEGTWDKSAKGSTEVRGKTLGIVGYGNVGSQLSDLAEGLGMRVSYYDKSDTLSRGNAQRRNSMEDVLSESDVVSVHVDGREDNRGLIDESEFGLMREGVIFLNLSRGAVVNIEALTDALRSGKIKGAAIDVFPDEPSGNDQEFMSPLRNMPNVILTPHIAGSTEEAQERIGGFVAHKIVDFINTGNTMGSVNLPNVETPSQADRHRLLHIHKNVPGVMSDINQIFSSRNMNVAGLHLETNNRVGYAIIDVDQGYDRRALRDLKKVKGTIKSRVLY